MREVERSLEISSRHRFFFGILQLFPREEKLVLYGIDLDKEKLFRDEPYDVIDFPLVPPGNYLIRSKKLMHFVGKLTLMSFVEREGPTPLTENAYIIFRNDEGEIKMTNITIVSTLLP
ncbi:hypothetical protein HYT59_00090 [Candidatus Woesebacteria bacterium]|nr:hypothetical protein [Candidatus Woesebacteria bacterium]